MKSTYTKNLIGILSMVMLLALSGCQKDSDPIAAPGRVPARQQAENVYLVETTDLQVTPGVCPIESSLLLTEEGLYFRVWENDIYYEDVTAPAGQEPQRLDIIFQEGESLQTFFVNDGGNIVCVVTNTAGDLTEKTFNRSGDLLSETALTGMENLPDPFLVNKAVEDGAGNLYIQTGACVLLFQADGQYRGEVDVPADFILDLGVSGDGRVYVTYYANMIDVLLSQVSFENCRLEGNAQIPGDGKLVTKKDKGFLLYDWAYLYEYDPGTDTYTVPMDWAEHYINGRMIRTLAKKEDGSIRVVTWNSSAQNRAEWPVELLRCTETTREEKQALEGQKQELVILSLRDSNPQVQELVVNFNKQSDRYHVTLEQYEATDNEYVNSIVSARTMGSDCPDLLLINYLDYGIYKEAKILEDLTPYLDGSEVLSREGFIESALAPLMEGEVVYAIPKSFAIETMLCRKSQVKSLKKQEGFSIENFIFYLENNDDVTFEWGGNPLEILQYCMRYGMEEFVDFEKGTCDFTGERFRNLVLRLQLMWFDLQGSNWETVLDKGGKIFIEREISSFYDLEKQKVYNNGELAILGYPTSDGSMRTTLRPWDIISVLHNSRCKEGAWEFVEFYMQNFYSPHFPSEKAAFEAQKAVAQDKNASHDTITDRSGNVIELHAVGKDQMQQIMEAIECAETVRIEEQVIMGFMLEELFYYMNGKKSLDDTLGVIQNKAQLYLDEIR